MGMQDRQTYRQTDRQTYQQHRQTFLHIVWYLKSIFILRDKQSMIPVKPLWYLGTYVTLVCCCSPDLQDFTE